MHYNSRRPKNGLTEWKVNALRLRDWLWLLRRSVSVFSTKPESGSFKGKIFKFHAEVEYIFFTSKIRTFQFAFWNQYCSHQISWLEGLSKDVWNEIEKLWLFVALKLKSSKICKSNLLFSSKSRIHNQIKNTIKLCIYFYE